MPYWIFAFVYGVLAVQTSLRRPELVKFRQNRNFDCTSCVACLNASEFLKSGHMDIGVRIDPAFAMYERAAIASTMDFWASRLDLSWRSEQSRSCALSFQYSYIDLFGDASIVASAQSPWFVQFDGEIVVNSMAEAPPQTEMEARRIFIHEVAHVLGLAHDVDTRSVMFPLYVDSDQYLTASDMQSLSIRHRLGNWQQIIPLYQESLAQ